jgi:hypothetical protein
MRRYAGQDKYVPNSVGCLSACRSQDSYDTVTSLYLELRNDGAETS